MPLIFAAAEALRKSEAATYAIVTTSFLLSGYIPSRQGMESEFEKFEISLRP